MAAKRKFADVDASGADDHVDPSDELLFTCLGGGNEVGRSCHIIQYKGKTIMLDAGMHPAHDGFASLPFFDEFDLGTVDVLLISHFHVDHAAALPYVLSKTNFKGRVFMTYPTKAIYKWLIQDSLRVGNLTSSAEQKITLYTEADHVTTFPLIEPIDFYTTHTVSSIRITPYPAGHVLGAAMYLIDIAGLKILFTGDYSREEDRHLVKATIPKDIKIDVLICESTFGTALHVPRLERETALMKGITQIIDQGGRALLPVFALGTAQELLLILDEYWSKHAKYQKTPIYYASNLARKCMLVYQTYISAMNSNIKNLFAQRLEEAERAGTSTEGVGPWDFRFIRALKSLERFEDLGPCVMLATPGMMQNGASRELLERWAPDTRNGVIITGYSVEGTMAQVLLNEPEFVTAVMTRKKEAMVVGKMAEEVRIPRRCSVQEISFAAHVDGQQNREFVEEVGATVVILVHGARHNMTRFKSKLLSLNSSKQRPIKVYSPANCEELRIPFKRDKFAKVVGRLAQIPPPKLLPDLPPPPAPGYSESKAEPDTNAAKPEERIISGVLVQSGFNLTLMAPEDLKEYAGLTTTTITFKKRLVCSAGIDLIRWGLDGMFGGVKDITDSDGPTIQNGTKPKSNDNHTNGHGIKKEDEETMDYADEEVKRSTVTKLLVMDSVTVEVHPNGEVALEWEGNMMNDGVADSVLAVLLQMETGAVGVKPPGAAAPPHIHAKHPPHSRLTLDPAAKFSRLLLLLENQFGSAVQPIMSAPPSTSMDAKKVESEESSNGLDHRDDALSIGGSVRAATTTSEVAPALEISLPPHSARIWLEDLTVECKNPALRSRILAVLEMASETVAGMGGQ